MMQPIDRTKISGLLDGELTPEEAAAMHRAFGEDEGLRREFELLAALDGKLKTLAEAAAFQPHVVLPSPQAAPPLKLILLVSAALAVRVATKLVPGAAAWAMSFVILVLIVGWGLGWMIRAADREFARLHAPEMGR